MPDQDLPLNPAEKVRPVLVVSLTMDNKIVVQGPMEKKVFCLSLLADVIKIVASWEPPLIKKPGE